MADTVTTQTITDTSGVKFVVKLTNLSRFLQIYPSNT